MSDFKGASTCLVSLANTSAAVCSSLELVSRLSETTLVFEQTSV